MDLLGGHGRGAVRIPPCGAEAVHGRGVPAAGRDHDRGQEAARGRGQEEEDQGGQGRSCWDDGPKTAGTCRRRRHWNHCAKCHFHCHRHHCCWYCQKTRTEEAAGNAAAGRRRDGRGPEAGRGRSRAAGGPADRRGRDGEDSRAAGGPAAPAGGAPTILLRQGRWKMVRPT